MNKRYLKMDTPMEDRLCVRFAESVKTDFRRDDTRISAICAKPNQTNLEILMNKMVEELQRIQLKYRHEIDNVIRQAFHRKFGRPMTALDAVDCRIDHKLGGKSIYYWMETAFLEAEEGDPKVEDLAHNHSTLIMTMEFTYL